MYRSELETDIQYLPGVGPKRAALLKSELQVSTIGELIRVYPFRYIDRSSVIRIADILPDTAHVQIQAKVIRCMLMGKGSQVLYLKDLDGTVIGGEDVRFNNVKRLSVIVSDGSGQIELVFFRGIRYTWNRLRPGETFLFFGKPAAFNAQINIVHPEIDAALDPS